MRRFIQQISIGKDPLWHLTWTADQKVCRSAEKCSRWGKHLLFFITAFLCSCPMSVLAIIICSIIIFGSVCWGGNISILDRGRLEKIVVKKKQKKKQVMMWESLWTVLRLHEKRLYRKLMQILNDPTRPMKHYYDSRRSNRSGRFLLPRTNTNCYKALFLPSALCQFLMSH